MPPAKKKNDKYALAAMRNALRDQVCVGPRYPGRPAEYSYVLAEQCRPKHARPIKEPAAAAAAKAPSAAAPAQHSRRPPRAASSSRKLGKLGNNQWASKELADLQREYESDAYKHRRETAQLDMVPANTMYVLTVLYVPFVLDDKRRQAMPNIMDRIAQVEQVYAKSLGTIKDSPPFPRMTLVGMLITTLKAVQAALGG